MFSKFWNHVKIGLEQNLSCLKWGMGILRNFLRKITLRNPFRWLLNRFSKFWHRLKSLVIAKLDCSHDENINLRKFWWVKFVLETFYVTKMLTMFSKFWHHVKIGLEQDLSCLKWGMDILRNFSGKNNFKKTI